MKLAEKFLGQRHGYYGNELGSGNFSACYPNTATTVIVANTGLYNAIPKLLTGIVLNKYFMKHFGKPYMLAAKRIASVNSFLVLKLDTNHKRHITIERYEKMFQAHELGTLYKSVFYPYLAEHRQRAIGSVWLDAKADNVGYYKGQAILFDSIPYVDDKFCTLELFSELCENYKIPYVIE